MKTDTPTPPNQPSPTPTQLVFATRNVFHQFSFKLSADGARYKLGRQIFTDVCKAAKVYGYITGASKPSGDSDEDWDAIDSRIKSWFYSTCEPNLLQIISSDSCTTKDLWDKLEEFFLNNKMSRMLHLQEQFRNTKKGSLTITNFFHTLKNFADALHDVDCEIKEVELVMQIIRQLPPSYPPGFQAYASPQQQSLQPTQPTDLASLFQAMSVQPAPDNNHYMDTDALSHMTNNHGF